jgi:hypothetical protein
MYRRNIRDTVLLSGWLFADLLLGLMMIFLVSIPGIQPKPVVVPTMTVSPIRLTPTSPECTGGTGNPQCTIMVGETPASVGAMTWAASSDISDSVVFSAATRVLKPGASVSVTISALPCENGSFTFTGTGLQGVHVPPVTVVWHCTAPTKRLNFHYQEFHINVDYQGLLNNSQSAINSVESQVRSQRFLQGQSVGLAVVYDGAPGDGQVDQALSVSAKVYGILKQLGTQNFAFQISSYYVPLFRLNDAQSDVIIDVYLFIDG